MASSSHCAPLRGPVARLAPVVFAAALLGGCAGDSTGPAGGAGPVASLVKVSGDSQKGAVASALSAPLVVRLTDAAGKPAGGSLVIWEVTAGGGSVSPAGHRSDTAGEARTTWTLGTTPGANTVTARSGDLSVSFTASAEVGAPAMVRSLSGSGQSALVGSALSTPLVIRVTDAFGNPVAGKAVTWAVSAGGGTITPASGTTDANGRASASWNLGSAAGDHTATATVAGLAPARFISRAADYGVNCTPSSLSVPIGSSATVLCTVRPHFAVPGGIALTTPDDNIVVGMRTFPTTLNFAKDSTVVVAVDLLAPTLQTRSLRVVARSGIVQRSDTIRVSSLPPRPVVNAIYLVPTDRNPNDDYTRAIELALRHLQIFYRSALGSGKTFTIARRPVRLIRTAHPASYYSTHHPVGYTDFSQYFWNNVTGEGLQLAGGSFDDPDDIWLLYIDADPACGQPTGGNAGVAVLPANDLRGLTNQPRIAPCPNEAPDPAPRCRWVGGLGHELGHTFRLPHPPGCPGPSCDSNALMWLGFRNYPGTYFTSADKDSLNQKAFFRTTDGATELFSCARPPGSAPADGLLIFARPGRGGAGEPHAPHCGLLTVPAP